MGIVIYICPESLVTRIPEVLRAAGYRVTERTSRKPVSVGTKLREPFFFEVSDGVRRLSLGGGEEVGKESPAFFFLVPKWSWDPRGFLGGRRFYRSVESVLMEAGARVATEEDLKN